MILVERKNQHRRDFRGRFICDHCGHQQEHFPCYDDEHFHANVIPDIACDACGKTSAPDGVRTRPLHPDYVHL